MQRDHLPSTSVALPLLAVLAIYSQSACVDEQESDAGPTNAGGDGDYGDGDYVEPDPLPFCVWASVPDGIVWGTIVDLRPVQSPMVGRTDPGPEGLHPWAWIDPSECPEEPGFLSAFELDVLVSRVLAGSGFEADVATLRLGAVHAAFLNPRPVADTDGGVSFETTPVRPEQEPWVLGQELGLSYWEVGDERFAGPSLMGGAALVLRNGVVEVQTNQELFPSEIDGLDGLALQELADGIAACPDAPQMEVEAARDFLLRWWGPNGTSPASASRYQAAKCIWLPPDDEGYVPPDYCEEPENAALPECDDPDCSEPNNADHPACAD